MNDVIKYRIDILRQGIFNREAKWTADSSPQIDFKALSPIKSSFKCELLEDIDLNQEELAPMLYRNGQWFNLGVFRPTTISVSGDEYSKRYNIEAYDRAWLLKTQKIESIIHLSAGTPYMTAIQNLLHEAGINLVTKDASSALIPVDREDWQIGTDYLTIINTLLNEIGFNDVWFDSIGAAHLDKYKPITSIAAKHRYSVTDITLDPISSEYETEEDIYNAPNVFIAICQNADRTDTLVARAENDSGISRKSTVIRGIRIPQVTKINQISDLESLQTVVDKLRDESMYGTKTISFETYAEGNHGLRDIVAIDHPDLFGSYEEIEWSITMDPAGLMSHKARKAVL